jgi:hypothetical protein
MQAVSDAVVETMISKSIDEDNGTVNYANVLIQFQTIPIIRISELADHMSDPMERESSRELWSLWRLLFLIS